MDQFFFLCRTPRGLKNPNMCHESIIGVNPFISSSDHGNAGIGVPGSRGLADLSSGWLRGQPMCTVWETAHGMWEPLLSEELGRSTPAPRTLKRERHPAVSVPKPSHPASPRAMPTRSRISGWRIMTVNKWQIQRAVTETEAFHSDALRTDAEMATHGQRGSARPCGLLSLLATASFRQRGAPSLKLWFVNGRTALGSRSLLPSGPSWRFDSTSCFVSSHIFFFRVAESEALFWTINSSSSSQTPRFAYPCEENYFTMASFHGFSLLTLCGSLRLKPFLIA